MKKILFLFVVLVSVTSFGQKKEKIKGNKEVLIKKFTVPTFSAMEIGEKFKVQLQKSTDTTRIVIETDDNLFDVIHFSVEDGVLRFSTSKEIVKYKRLRVTVFVPEGFNSLIVKEKAEVSNEEEISFNNLKINMSQRSELDLHLNIKNSLVIAATDKSELVINGSAKSLHVHLSESAQLKGELAGVNTEIVLDDHGYCKIEGSTKQLKLEARSKSAYKSKSYKVAEAVVKSYDKSTVQIHVSNKMSLIATGSSTTYIYGSPKIDLKSFKDDAILYKK